MKFYRIIFLLVIFPVSLLSQEKIVKLTDTPQFEGKPTWSPDGKFIAYAARRDREMNIWKIPAEGGEPVRLTYDTKHNFYPSWSPDGKKIAFQATVESGINLFLMATDGVDIEQLTADGGEWPIWHPGGDKILFKKGDNENIKYYIIDINSKEVKLLYETDKKGFLSRPVWHPDGINILFSIRPTWALPGKKGNLLDFSNIYMYNTRQKFIKVLTKNKLNTDRAQLTVDPSGKYFAFIEGENLHIASIIKAPTIDYKKTIEINGLDPAWSPDGKKIAFSSKQNYDICLLYVDF